MVNLDDTTRKGNAMTHMLLSCTWDFIHIWSTITIYIYIPTHMDAYIHMYVGMYIYIYTYIYIYIHVYICRITCDHDSVAYPMYPIHVTRSPSTCCYSCGARVMPGALKGDVNSGKKDVLYFCWCLCLSLFLCSVLLLRYFFAKP